MALAAGVPMKVVSENLGHSTLAVTANVYSHVTTELAKDSAERVAALLDSNAM
jgi:integrase